MSRWYGNQLWGLVVGMALLFTATAWADPAEDAYKEGIRLAEKGVLKQARDEFDKAIRLKPTYAEAFSARGSVRNRLMQNTLALEDFEEAIRLNPNFTEAYYNRANVYMDIGQRENAIQDYSAAIKLNPSHAEAFYNRGLVYLMLGRGEAADDARSYLELRGWTDERAMYVALIGYLGYRYKRQNEEAQKLIDEAKAKGNTATWPYPIVRYFLRESSLQELLEAATDNDKRTEAHAYAGMELSLSGKRDEALTHLKWVSENGNKGFIEYTFAASEQERIEPTASN